MHLYSGKMERLATSKAAACNRARVAFARLNRELTGPLVRLGQASSSLVTQDGMNWLVSYETVVATDSHWVGPCNYFSRTTQRSIDAWLASHPECKMVDHQTFTQIYTK